MPGYATQNNLLLNNLLDFYNKNDNLEKMLCIINGESNISLRIVDWFATNYAKKHYTVYDLDNGRRFKVYIDYKLMIHFLLFQNWEDFWLFHQARLPLL